MLKDWNEKKMVHKMYVVPLRDLYVLIPQPGKKPMERPRRPIFYSPYYHSLKHHNSREFESAAQWTSSPSTNTWHKFQELLKSIQLHGFQSERGRPIQLTRKHKNGWQVYNGHHRVSVLMYLYPQGKLLVKKSRVVGFVKN